MLEKIREGSQGVWAMVILGLVILSFVFAGVGSYVTSSANVAAAEVNGDEILISDLERAYQNERARMESQYGDAFATLAADANYLAQFRRGILDRMIGDKLLDQQAVTMGLRVSDADVRKAIVSMPEFQLGGQFNNDRYMALLRQAGFQASDFRDYMRIEMTRQQLTQALLGSEFSLQEEIKQVLALQQQTRDGRYLTIPADSFAGEIEINEQQITDYYQANITDFDTQEKVSLDYVLLNSAKLSEDIQVTQQELRDYYDRNQDSYRDDEQRRVSHILVEFGEDKAAAKEKIEKALAELKAGADFAAVATTYSSDSFSAENGGDLDWLTRGELDPDFEKAAFALAKVGEMTEPVASEFGYHIIKLTDLKAETVTPFAQVQEDIRSILNKDKADERFYELQQRAAELAFEVPDSLQDVANELELEVKTSALFTRNQAPTELNHPAVLAAAFSPELIEDRVNSDVIETANGQMMVVRVAQHEPARTKSQQEVTAQVQDILLADQAQQAAMDWANGLIEQLDAGQDVSASLTEKSLNWQELKQQARFGADVPQPVVSSLFTLAPVTGQSLQATELQNGDVALVELSKVNQSEQVAPAEMLNAIKGQLNQGRAQAELVALVASLKSQADIKIYD